ncbi:transposase orf1, IS66 family protein [Galbibacter marinus]|uniref:Transposase orf1, IS66 family protein n=1 Tax=Galbibacter marinus TaxID=555500 RepID=K2PR43_9FLAO|nr:IS66 family insertion sequence element accessory protein TnpB [Galbibacter marinus]EKF54004.1 transposase orf1, IS66 family protein [Galbibacter marinus]
MFALGTAQKYYLCRSFCDMRKSFDGLCGLVMTDLKREPHNGDVYIFINKSRDKIKLLQWQPGGFVLYYKRLERGRFFRVKDDENSGAITLDYHQLVMLIEGIQFKEIKRQKRYKNVLQK